MVQIAEYLIETYPFVSTETGALAMAQEVMTLMDDYGLSVDEAVFELLEEYETEEVYIEWLL